MNNSSGRILIAVLAIAVGGGAVFYLGNKIFWSPYSEAQAKLAALNDEVDKRERTQHDPFKRDKKSVEKWKTLSLPKDPTKAASEFDKMLRPLLRDAGLVVDDFQGPPPQENAGSSTQKKPKHVVLPFQVRAKGSLESLAKALDALQRMPVAHRVKTLVVDRVDAKDRTGRVGVQMTIEALIVAGTENKLKLDKPSPPVTNRTYTEVALRNPFLGAQPPPPPPPVAVKKDPPPPPVEVVEEPPAGPDPREFIRIDTIVPTSNEAFLRNMLYKAPPLRLRSTPMSGYDTFRITNEDRSRVFVKGKVLRIDARDIFFQVAEDVYRFHFGQTLAEAMIRPLNDAQLEEFQLTALVDADFAKQDADEKKAKASTKTKTFKKGR